MSRLFVSPERLEASICRDSFFDFFKRFWNQIVLEPLILNWHIEYLCNEVQKVAERMLARQLSEGDLVVNVPPATTKSTICSRMLPAWLWARDPSIRMICGAHTQTLSNSFALATRRVVLSEKYRRLFPGVMIEGELVENLRTNRGGERISTSTGGNVVGKHGHILILDDPIDPASVQSRATMQSVHRWISQSLLNRRLDRGRNPLILIMQRLHQDDPSEFIRAMGRDSGHPVKSVVLPAICSNRVEPEELKERYNEDGLLDPVRLSQTVLDQTRVEMGEYGFAGQYQQNPVPAEGGMFRVAKLVVEPSCPTLTREVRYWDKAGTYNGGAYTVGLRMGRDTVGKWWIRDVKRGQWEAGDRERRIKQTAEEDGKTVEVGVEQEPGSGGKWSADETVKMLPGWRVRVDRPVGDKITRADVFASQVNIGNVGLVRGDWNREYVSELEYFPQSKYKDQVDASSGAFGLLNKTRRMLGALGGK